MKLQLTIRDLFWLVLVVAVSLSWWARERQIENRHMATLRQRDRVISLFERELVWLDYLIDYDSESVAFRGPRIEAGMRQGSKGIGYLQLDEEIKWEGKVQDIENDPLPNPPKKGSLFYVD